LPQPDDSDLYASLNAKNQACKRTTFRTLFWYESTKKSSQGLLTGKRTF